ncbi:MAG: Na+/H+ antiporter subunit E [Bacillus sp. (in: firmicutes)]
MAFQILLNVFLAFIWMFLGHSYNPGSFVIGYLLGLLLLFVFRKAFSERFYLHSVWAVIKLLFIFIFELIMANISVLKVVLKPKLDMKPGIFAMETELTKPWQVTILSNLITLTPGTLVVSVSDDNKTLYIHAMDIRDLESEIKGIKDSFEKTIMEVSG